jgi:hypothetical protein
MASLFAAAANSARQMAIDKIPSLIETYEPQIETQLKTSLSAMKPEEKELFLTNWNKLNRVIQGSLVGGRRKRTQRRHRRR